MIDVPKGGDMPIFTQRASVTHQRRTTGAVLLSRNTVIWIKLDPIFDPLRDDPRFAAMVHQVGAA